MNRVIQSVFGIDEKGRPPLHNSRQQLLVAGLICLIIHPGILIGLLVIGDIDSQDVWWVLVNPYSLITLLGVWLIGMSVFSRTEWPKFKKSKQKELNK